MIEAKKDGPQSKLKAVTINTKIKSHSYRKQSIAKRSKFKLGFRSLPLWDLSPYPAWPF
ncbi:hypothetical protein HYR69_08840 [Candidatus Sumerlaeota bacterium]|nr:hypothetical protein [Candidatus Sumerlaeota bacterium]